MKLKTKNRGFNFLGKQVDISDGTNDVSGPFGTDVELLKFYIKMLYEGTLKIGSSGFKRMCTIKAVSYTHLRAPETREERGRRGVVVKKF